MPKRSTPRYDASVVMDAIYRVDGDRVVASPDAESWIGPDGAGLAMARRADEGGYFGRAVQSLVIEPR
jgi:hypothetical protein